MYNWRKSPSYRQVPFAWHSSGSFTDRNGQIAEVGVHIRLLIDAVATDDHGQAAGHFAAGQEFVASHISRTDPPLLYVEGIPVEEGWAMCGIPPQDVQVVSAAD